MDLRPRWKSRLDRAGFAVQRVLPSRLKDPLLADAETALGSIGGKRAFMRFADAFRSKLFERLAAAYGDDLFAKLLAVKLSNLAVAQHHYRRRHADLVARPVQLTVDPTNACQLACPGCVHTANPERRELFDWPRLAMPASVHDAFLERTGPFAFSTLLYNYGEPLLHKDFPEFVRSAKRFLLFTHTSTNLSMPLPDTDALVASGLDRIVCSIDGATQDVYARYRRSGNLEMVLDNVRRLVAARKRSGRRTPYLVWQFLTFRHNAHQVRDAIRTARALGVDEAHIETPFGVEHDDADIQAVTVRERGRHVFARWDGNWCSKRERRGVETAAPAIEREFARSWEERFDDETGGAEEPTRGAAPTCDWLYQNVTLDGARRVLPCCMAPEKTDKPLVFARFGLDDGDRLPNPANTPMAFRARLAFGDRADYDARAQDLPAAEKPFCAECREKPPPYHLNNIAGDVWALDEARALPRMLAAALTGWKR